MLCLNLLDILLCHQIILSWLVRKHFTADFAEHEWTLRQTSLLLHHRLLFERNFVMQRKELMSFTSRIWILQSTTTKTSHSKYFKMGFDTTFTYILEMLLRCQVAVLFRYSLTRLSSVKLSLLQKVGEEKTTKSQSPPLEILPRQESRSSLVMQLKDWHRKNKGKKGTHFYRCMWYLWQTCHRRIYWNRVQ
jgi:hypothetical protein